MYIFGEDNQSSTNDIQTLDDLRKISEEQRLHQKRIEASKETLEISNDMITILKKAQKQRIQNQSTAAPFFSELLSSALQASFGGRRLPMYTGNTCPPIVLSFMADKRRISSIESKYDYKEVQYHAQVASHLAPFLNGIASIICPTENFRQAVTSMKMPKAELALELLEKAVGSYVVTLPSLQGLFGEHSKYDKALLDSQGLFFIKLYRADADGKLTSKLHIPEKLVFACPGSERGEMKKVLEDNFKSHLNAAKPEQGLVIEAYLASRSFTLPTTEPIPVRELLQPKSKQTPEEGTIAALYQFCLNIIMQAASQGNVTTSSNVVLDGTHKLGNTDTAIARAERNKQASRSNRPLNCHRLTLNPDISIFDIREKESEQLTSASEAGGILPHWRTAHMHSFWKGSGSDRYLGLPQLVQGCFVDGSKARAKRERQKKRLEMTKSM